MNFRAINYKLWQLVVLCLTSVACQHTFRTATIKATQHVFLIFVCHKLNLHQMQGLFHWSATPIYYGETSLFKHKFGIWIQSFTQYICLPFLTRATVCCALSELEKRQSSSPGQVQCSFFFAGQVIFILSLAQWEGQTSDLWTKHWLSANGASKTWELPVCRAS